MKSVAASVPDYKQYRTWCDMFDLPKAVEIHELREICKDEHA
jgi:hypothetical protein